MPPSRTALLAAAALACASGPAQLYDGPARPRDQVALIRQMPLSKARVFAIDRARTDGTEWWVTPGPHPIWVNFQVIRHAGDTIYTIYTYCLMSVDASAGETYRIESFATQQPAQGGDVKTTLGVRVLDTHGAQVGIPATCTGNRPQLD